MITSNNEWQRVITNDNEWQLTTGSGTTNENKWEQVKQSDFKFQNETKDQSGSWRISFNFLFYAIYNYTIFSNIDNLFVSVSCKYFFFFFATNCKVWSSSWKYNGKQDMLLIKKVVARFDKK